MKKLGWVASLSVFFGSSSGAALYFLPGPFSDSTEAEMAFKHSGSVKVVSFLLVIEPFSETAAALSRGTEVERDEGNVTAFSFPIWTMSSRKQSPLPPFLARRVTFARHWATCRALKCPVLTLCLSFRDHNVTKSPVCHPEFVFVVDFPALLHKMTISYLRGVVDRWPWVNVYFAGSFGPKLPSLMQPGMFFTKH